ncbi:hypothetical protein ACO0LM_23815 [Undibacterium sp. Di26W]|uniref:hypothetical protein n=1 Tax=Undibacterium sp. Di26W TaxID=3413035 RepID=UPI003BEFEAA1
MATLTYQSMATWKCLSSKAVGIVPLLMVALHSHPLAVHPSAAPPGLAGQWFIEQVQRCLGSA